MILRPHTGRRKHPLGRDYIEKLAANRVSAGERRRLQAVPLAMNFYCHACRSYRSAETCQRCGNETSLHEDA